MKTNKIVFWATTGLLSLMMLFSVYMYLFNTPEISTAFTNLGFPTWIIYPLAIAKILGVLAITTRMNDTLKEWAYAGFFFDFLLAAGAHLSVGDGEHWGAIIAAVLLLVSYFFGKRAFGADTA